jgi:hypothetical protein
VVALTGGAPPHVSTNASTPMHGHARALDRSGRDRSHGLAPHAHSLGHAAGGAKDAEREAFAAAADRAKRPLWSRQIDLRVHPALGRVRGRGNVYARAAGGRESPTFRRDLDALRARFDADAAPERTLAWLEDTERDPARRHALLQDLQRLVLAEAAPADRGDRADALATAVEAHRARFLPQINLAEDVGRALKYCPDTNPATSKALRDAYFAAVGGLGADTVLHPVTFVQAMRSAMSELGLRDLRTAVDELNRAMLAVHANTRATRFPGSGANLALNGSSLVVHLQTALALCEEGVRRLSARGIPLAQETSNTAAKQILGMTISPTHPMTLQALVESLAGPDPKAGLALTQEILVVIRRLDDSIWPSPAARDGVVQTVQQSCDRLQGEPAATPSAAALQPAQR